MPTTRTPSYQDRDTIDKIAESGPRLIRMAGIIIGAILALIFVSKLFFSVNNHEVVALTYPNGTVRFFTHPGSFNPQWFGHLETFEKQQKYDFEERIQFSDGAHASIKGSVQYQVPLDTPSLQTLYALYPTPEAVEKGLIETNIQKSVYLTGRMMSSKESYAERRGDLLSYMEDQLANGIYQTRTLQQEAPDPLDDKKTRNVTVTQIVVANGQPARQELGVGAKYHIATSNFTMTVAYDSEVEKQIQQQQVLAQSINTSIAESRQAEQRAITAAKNGEANAATAKWEQEKINATEQARSEQLVRNAELQKKEAEFTKQKLILEGEGEAQKRQLIMNADGALDKKLDALVKMNAQNADAIKNYQGNWVPQFITGGGGATNGTALLDVLGAQAVRNLSLDLTVKGKQK